MNKHLTHIAIIAVLLGMFIMTASAITGFQKKNASVVLTPTITSIDAPVSMNLDGFGDPYEVTINGTNFASSSLVSINGGTDIAPMSVSSDGTSVVFKFFHYGPASNYGPTVIIQVVNGHLFSNSNTLVLPNDVRG